MRVYVPATFDMLGVLAGEGTMPVRSGVGFALTPALREFYTSGDEEEIGYQAFLDAARASLRLLAIEDEERFPARRVVLSVDVDDDKLTLAPEDGEAVVEVIDRADLGDGDAEIMLGDCEDNLMSWYDAKELAFLVDLL